MMTIFTDGSSRGNPGPGGWGVVVVSDEKAIELGGGEKNTTNNRMELSAVIHGLRKASECFGMAPNASEALKIYTDSRYIVNGITKWIYGWKRNGWKTKAKEDVLNKDLWMELDEILNGIGSGNVSWEYVGGHVGIAGNERCDVIATSFADGEKIELYNGPLSGYPVKNILDISHDAIKATAKKSSSSRSNAKAYSYVSKVGGIIKIHDSWADCERRVKGAKGARFKKTLDAADEAAVVNEFGGVPSEA